MCIYRSLLKSAASMIHVILEAMLQRDPGLEIARARNRPAGKRNIGHAFSLKLIDEGKGVTMALKPLWASA